MDSDDQNNKGALMSKIEAEDTDWDESDNEPPPIKISELAVLRNSTVSAPASESAASNRASLRITAQSRRTNSSGAGPHFARPNRFSIKRQGIGKRTSTKVEGRLSDDELSSEPRKRPCYQTVWNFLKSPC